MPLSTGSGVSPHTATTLNSAVSLQGSFSTAPNPSIDSNADVGLGLLGRVLTQPGLVSDGTISLVTQAGAVFTQVVSAGAINAYLTLAHQQGVGVQTRLDYSPTLNLGVALDASQSGGASISDSIGLAVAAALNTDGGRQLVADLALQLTSGVSSQQRIFMEGVVDLGMAPAFVSTSAGVMGADAAFSAQFLQSLAAQAVQDAGISLDAATILYTNGVDPSVIIRTKRGREILLTANGREILLTANGREILLTANGRELLITRSDRSILLN